MEFLGFDIWYYLFLSTVRCKLICGLKMTTDCGGQNTAGKVNKVMVIYIHDYIVDN